MLVVGPDQRGVEHLGERLVGLERGQEQALSQVRVRLQREPAAVGPGRGLQRVEARRGLAGFARPDPDHLGVAGQPGGQALAVLGLGRLDHQPRDPGPGSLLQQVPDRLGLARAGCPADERVPVQ